MNHSYPHLVVHAHHAASVRLLFVILTVACVRLLAANAPAPATISGRVFNTSSGRYVDNARVTAQGTSLEAVTDEFGSYTLRNVPEGAVTVTASYVGEGSKSVTLSVNAGAAITQDFEIGNGAATRTEGTVVLDQYKVSADRYKTSQEIAINEERMSVNIKNVVSAEAYGHIADGNIGEFVKFLPGVQVTYGGTNQSDADATGISIRGFGPEYTGIMVDGAPISNPTAASLTNQLSLNMLSVNNASRIEVIKVPTPDMPTDQAGGYVNIVSRSAFEYARPTFGGRVYIALNSENLELLKKTPGPANKKTFKTVPGADFFVAYPVNKKFGFSVSLFSSNQIGVNQRDQPAWQRTSTNFDRRPIGGPNGVNTDANGDAASLANPYINRFSITDSPRITYKLDGSTKLDWRPTPSQTLSATLGYSTYTSINVDRRIQYSMGAPQDWGETFVHGYAYVPASASQNKAAMDPKHNVAMTITARDTVGRTKSGSMRYQLNKDAWTIKAFGSASQSSSGFRDVSNGHFSSLDVSYPNNLVGLMSFDGIRSGEPGTISVKDQAGNPSDPSQIAAWGLSSSLVPLSGDSSSRSDVYAVSGDLRRDLDFIPWRQHLALQVGGRQDIKKDAKSGGGSGHKYHYIGTTPLTTSQLLDEGYFASPGYGLPAQQWVDLYKLYDFYKANPNQFSDTDSTVAIDNYNSYVNQQKYLKQTKNAWYAMLDGALLNNRLHVVAGPRWSEDRRDGYGPFIDGTWMYVKNPDGTLYRDAVHPNGVRFDQSNSDLFATTAAGNALRSALGNAKTSYPDHVIATPSTNLEARKLQLIPARPIHQKARGKPTWSINTSYDITENLIGKVSYSRSQKQPPLENSTQGVLSGNNAFTITENTSPTADLGGDGAISVANPGLLPENKNSWDFELDWYTKNGGKLGVTYSLELITNRHQTFSVYNNDPAYAEVLGGLGLDDQTYRNYKISTTVNGIGTSHNNVWEFEVSQDFGFLGNWGKSFRTYLTYTHKKLTDSTQPGIVAFPITSDKFGSAGLFFSRGRWSANMRGTYTDLSYNNSQSTVSFNGVTYIIRQFKPAVWKFDADLNYQLTKHFSLFASGRDVFHKGLKTINLDAAGVMPGWATLNDERRFGVIITAGVEGRF